MGVFKKLFNKESNKTNNGLSDQSFKHKAEWDFYLSNVDDVVGSFYIDLGLVKIAPLADYRYLVWISVKMNDPKIDGLSSKEESNILFQIEDHLIEAINKKHRAVFTGRLTSNNRREFYFYFSDPFLHDKTIADAMVAFPGYDYDFEEKVDAKWEHYLDFQYPLPSQIQSIQNRKVLDQLEKNGDKLVKERQVDHWLFFENSADRDVFLEKIKDDGFQIVANDHDIVFGEKPYRLRIARVDKVGPNDIDNYTLYLSGIAQECNGEYDGWETSVEKED